MIFLAIDEQVDDGCGPSVQAVPHPAPFGGPAAAQRRHDDERQADEERLERIHRQGREET